LIVSDRPAVAAGAFTTNRVKAPRCRIGRSAGAVACRPYWSTAAMPTPIPARTANGWRARDPAGGDAARDRRASGGAVVDRPHQGAAPPRVRRGVLGGCAGSLLAPSSALEGMMTTDAFPKFAVERLRARRPTGQPSPAWRKVPA
jgi:hypothetical protein